MYISNGGYASGITVSSRYAVSYGDNVELLTGYRVPPTDANGNPTEGPTGAGKRQEYGSYGSARGSLYIGKGGSAYDVSNMGLTVVYSGGILHNVSNFVGGSVTISGGTIKGNTILGDIDVDKDTGGTLDFTVAELDTIEHGHYVLNDLYKINNWNKLNFTITVDPNQADGIYGLSQNAYGFSKTISIGGFGAATETLVVNNTNAVMYGNKFYNVILDDAGNLALSVQSTDPAYTKPVAPTYKTSAPTNEWYNGETITVTVDYSFNSFEKKYSYNGVDWIEYTGAIEVDHVKTIYFKGINVAGIESDVVTLVIDKLDNDAPEFEIARTAAESYSTSVELCVVSESDYHKYANGNFVYQFDQFGQPVYELDEHGRPRVDAEGNWIQAKLQGNIVKHEYLVEGGNSWQVGTKVIVNRNCTVWFRTTDAAGNVTVKEFVVDTIGDTSAPTIAVEGNPTEWTNAESIVITATATGLGNKFGMIEYSTDGINWIRTELNQDGSAVISSDEITQNTTIYFRATDAAGNQIFKDVVIDKIDNTQAAVNVTGNVDNWTTENVTLNITTDDGVNQSGVVKIEYRFGNDDWTDSANTVIVQGNAASITLTENANVYIKVTDAAGNVTEHLEKVTLIGTPEAFSVPTNQPYEVERENIYPEEANVQIETFKWQFSATDSEAPEAGSWNTSSIVSIPSNGYLWISVNDANGNEQPYKIVINNIEKVAPAVEFEYDKAPTKGDSLALAVKASDASGISEMYYRMSETDEWTKFEDSELAFAGNEASASIDITDNGTVFIKVVDKAGNEGFGFVDVTNFDREDPTFKVEGLPTEYTSESVTLNVIAADKGTAGISKIQYRFEGETDYRDAEDDKITVDNNGTVYIKVIDKAGNESEQKFDISKIDKYAPTVTITPDKVAATNENVIVDVAAADAGAGVDKILYRFGNSDWTDTKNTTTIAGAAGKITVFQNGTIFVKVIDKVGREFVDEIKINNIDKLAPSVEITGNKDEWTADDIVLTVSAQDLVDAGNLNITSGVASIQYLDANGEWQNVGENNSINVSANGTVYVKVTDNAGNVTETFVEVTKIDKNAPTFEVSGNAEDFTNQDVILEVKAADAGSGIKDIQYRFGEDGEFVSATDAKIVVEDNCTVYIKVIDNVGRETIDTVEVTKIDKTALGLDLQYNREWTTGSTTVTAIASEGSANGSNAQSGIVRIGYSYDNIEWHYVNGATIDAVVSANGTVYFKTVDAAGNVATKEVNVDWLDNDKPTFEINGVPADYTNSDVVLDIAAQDSHSGIGKILYRFDENWNDELNTFTATGTTITITENKTVYIKVIDNVGNEAVSSVVIDKIDKDAPKFKVSGNPASWVKGSITLTPEFEEDFSGIAKIEYKLADGEWIESKDGIIENIDKNQTVYYRVTDNAGNVTNEKVNVDFVDNDGPEFAIIRTTPEGWTNKAVTVVAVATDDKAGMKQMFYSYDNISWFEGYAVPVENAATIYFKAVDKVGNETIKEFAVSNIDKEKPSVEILGITADWTAGQVELKAVASDKLSRVAQYEYKLEGGEWTIGDTAFVDRNQTVAFRVTDNAGNTIETTVEVKNIDKDEPIISISGNTAKWTNQDVILTGSAIDTKSGISELWYSYDKINWFEGATAHISSNRTVYFKAVDNVGNTAISSIDVNNIDKEDPTVDITGNAETWTRNNVTLTANAADDASDIAKIEYSFDGAAWVTSKTAVVSKNGTVKFRVTDKAGNVIEESVDVIHIDTDGPTIDISGNPTEWTNDSVTIVATAADDKSGVEKIEYKINNSGWTTGRNVVVDKNATITFRVTDKVGNYTESTVSVSKIDKDAPALVVSGNAVEWTNSDVTLIATTDDKASRIAKVEYNFNNTGWKDGRTAVISENGTVEFRVIDNAGNVTTEIIEVNRIDKAAPTLSISGNVTNWTNGDVTLSAIAGDSMSGIKEVLYSFDNKTWTYGRDVTVQTNGVVYFKAIDKVGNETTASVEVNNIDKDAPTLAVSGNAAEWTNSDVTLVAAAEDNASDIAKVEYRFNGGSWTTGSEAVIKENGTVEFRVTDKVGNVTEQVIVVDKIDKELPTLTISGNVTEWTNKDVVLTAAAGDAKSGVKEIWYSFDNAVWTLGSKAIAEANGTVYFKAIDNVGNEKISSIDVTNIDKDNPIVNITGNVTEWTGKDVTLSANVTDNNGSGIAKVEYNINNTGWKNGSNAVVSANGTVEFRVTDNVGNVTKETVVVDKIDKDAPVITVTGNAADWINGDVTLEAIASDSLSGVAKIEYQLENGKWVTENKVVVSSNRIVAFRVTDNVGNVATENVYVSKIDKDAPVITITGNTNVWTKNDIVLTGSAVDEKSGIKEVWYSFDNETWTLGNKAVATANGTVYFKAVDNVGNETVSSVEVAKIDKDAPTLSISGNAVEWTKNNVNLVINADDKGSGIAKIEYNFNDTGWVVADYSADISSNGTVVFRVTDKVGNVTEQTIVVDKIDKENPALTLSGNAKEWTKNDVTIAATATDSLSGIVKVEYNVNNTGWVTGTSVDMTANGVVEFRATDKVGNVSTEKVIVDKIDKDAPTVKISGTSSIWTNNDVVLSATAADAKSGVKNIFYSFDNAYWYKGDKATVTANGTVYFKAVDNVGNETISSVDVTNIDKDAPALSVSADTTAWTNGEVVLTGYATDAKSGIREIWYSFDNATWSKGEYATAAANGTVYFKAIDNVGNETVTSYNVTNIDKDAPVLSISGNPTEWISGNATLVVSASDSASGLDKVEYSIDGSSWQTGSSIVVSKNSVVKFRATDKVGNVIIETVTVDKIDKEAPAVTITADTTEWTNGDVVLTAAAADAKSGIKEVWYSFDNSTWTLGSKATATANGTVYFKAVDNVGNETISSMDVNNIDKTAPTLGVSGNAVEWTNGNVTLVASAKDSASGLAKVEYSINGSAWQTGSSIVLSNNAVVNFRATDNVGNIVEETVFVDKIDKEAPAVTITADTTEWTGKNVVLTGSATDAKAGVKEIQYSFDNVTWVVGDKATATANGIVYFKAIDNVGNEKISAIEVANIDKEAPVVTIKADETAWTNKDVVLTGFATDAKSGIKEIQYSFDNVTWVAGDKAVATTNGTVYFKAIDNVGNETVSSMDVKNIDKTAPTLGVSGNAVEWINGNVTLTATAADSASGIGKVEYSINGSDWQLGSNVVIGNNSTVIFRATDNVGNIVEKTIIVDKIDKDAPVLTVTGNAADWINGNVTVSATATDALSGLAKIEYNINNTGWVTGTSVDMAANGIVEFRATDNVGNVVTELVLVNKIDKDAPELTISGASTVWTSNDVVLTASATDDKSGVRTIYYSFDNQYWVKGDKAVAAANGTVFFKAVDKVGNETVSSVDVTNIDKEAPVVTITADVTEWTNQSVVLTGSAVDAKSGVKEILYSFDNTAWVKGESVTVTANGTVYFKAIDNVGNEAVSSIDISNFDKEIPVVTITADVTEWTNKNVVLTGSATDAKAGVKEIQYSFDNVTWVVGDKATATANGTVYFKAIDNVGNESVSSFAVTNIDKDAPTVSVAGNPTDWVAGSVTLVATASDSASGVQKIEFSLDNISWEAGATVLVDVNKTVYFRVTDNAGNVTKETVVVDKIDKDDPTITVAANTTQWTNKDVILTATVNDPSSQVSAVEYSFDNSSWTVGSVATVAANGVVYFRVTDKVGNVSSTSFVVSNIDKDDPTLSISGNATDWTDKPVTLKAAVSDALSGISKTEYSLDNSTWTVGTSVSVSSNCTVYFKTTDNAGNTVVDSVVVDKIDTTAPVISVSGMPEADTRKAITLTANVTDSGCGVALVEYSLDNTTWFLGNSVTVKVNGTVYFRATDNIGNVSDVTVVTVDKIIEDPADDNILRNGTSQIVGWDMQQGKVGYIAINGEQAPEWHGVYEWHRGDALKWRVAGVGHFAGSEVDYDGILLYNSFGDTFAAWTDLDDPSYGYVSLCHVGNNFNTNGLADLDGNQYDDILIYDENGSFGVVLDGTTYKDIWHSEDAETNAWKLEGSGTFGKGNDKLIVKNTYNGHLYLWNNNDSSFNTWNWSQTDIGFLGEDWEFVAAGDFSGDGVDDIIVRKVADGGLWMWDNGNSATSHWVVTPGEGFAAEAVGDYNGDGKDDLLVREYNTGWGGLGYYAFGSDQLWNDLNARIETDHDSKFAIIA